MKTGWKAFKPDDIVLATNASMQGTSKRAKEKATAMSKADLNL